MVLVAVTLEAFMAVPVTAHSRAVDSVGADSSTAVAVCVEGL